MPTGGRIRSPARRRSRPAGGGASARGGGPGLPAGARRPGEPARPAPRAMTLRLDLRDPRAPVAEEPAGAPAGGVDVEDVERARLADVLVGDVERAAEHGGGAVVAPPRAVPAARGVLRDPVRRPGAGGRDPQRAVPAARAQADVRLRREVVL